jgi:flagellar hook protein FlgE
MLNAIYIGLSGLGAFSQGLQTISNNVANLNSPGFKTLTPKFDDAFNTGGVAAGFSGQDQDRPLGTGVSFGQPQIDFRQGELRTTQNDLDLGITGGGFLALQDGSNTFYTRTGQFSVDNKGFIVETGTTRRLTSVGAGGELIAINVDAKRTYPPQATTRIIFADNLSSTATDAAVSRLNVYDSLGVLQTWNVAFKAKGATAPGVWDVTVTNQTGSTLATATLRFIGSTVDPINDKITVSTNPVGGDPLNVVLDFSTGITSFSSGTTSTIRAKEVDGYALGTLTTTTVDENGKIKLTYSNEKTDTLGAIALADFAQPQKLEQRGKGLFSYIGTDLPRYLKSGDIGVGKIAGRQQEASNVDLSAEFGSLILIQRGYQASSQVVSTANDMIQQLFGIRGQ